MYSLGVFHLPEYANEDLYPLCRMVLGAPADLRPHGRMEDPFAYETGGYSVS